MKLNLFMLCFLVISGVLLNAQEGKKITILHTNDFHSHFLGYAPETAYTPFETDGDPTVGGFARIAGIIAETRSENPGITLVLDGGD